MDGRIPGADGRLTACRRARTTAPLAFPFPIRLGLRLGQCASLVDGGSLHVAISIDPFVRTCTAQETGIPDAAGAVAILNHLVRAVTTIRTSSRYRPPTGDQCRTNAAAWEGDSGRPSLAPGGTAAVRGRTLSVGVSCLRSPHCWDWTRWVVRRRSPPAESRPAFRRSHRGARLHEKERSGRTW